MKGSRRTAQGRLRFEPRRTMAPPGALQAGIAAGVRPASRKKAVAFVLGFRDDFRHAKASLASRRQHSCRIGGAAPFLADRQIRRAVRHHHDAAHRCPARKCHAPDAAGRRLFRQCPSERPGRGRVPTRDGRMTMVIDSGRRAPIVVPPGGRAT